MPALQDLTGRTFGRLTVIERGPDAQGANRIFTTWACRCTCGVKKNVRGISLKNGNTSSCGCGSNAHSHGMTKTRTLKSWDSMRQRCNNPNDKSYVNYGGRGIKVCERWNKFENFLADMGVRPEGTSIDRINNDGRYEPGNCRWATFKEQNNNRRPARRKAVSPLIAAAPEMLAALKEITDQFEAWMALYPEEADAHDETTFKKARSAISKAEGAAQ